MGCHFLLQGIFLTLGLLHCRQIPYQLSHQGSSLFVTKMPTLLVNSENLRVPESPDLGMVLCVGQRSGVGWWSRGVPLGGVCGLWEPGSHDHLGNFPQPGSGV